MKPILKSPPLNMQQTRELATMVEAGISIADAWEKSSASQHLAGQSILKALRQGTKLAVAFRRFGLVTAPQQIFLAAADDAGSLPSALLRLATEGEQRAARRKQLGSRLGITYFLLFIGWSVGMVLAIAESSEELGSVFFTNIAKCLIAYVIIQMIAKLCFKDSWWWMRQAWNFGGLKSKAYSLNFITHWLDLLGWQLAAGIDAASSLRAMQGLIPGSTYRSATGNAIKLVQNGQTLSVALSDSGLLPNVEIESVLVAAEASGKIGESLEHQTRLAEHDLNLYIDQLMFWLPKVLYALTAGVALSMVYESFGSSFIPDY
jgi:type II secretory pathway component PulF